MKKTFLTLFAVTSIAVLFVNCGDSPKTVPIGQSSYAVAFLQQKPNSNLLYPALGSFSGTQFSTTMIKDPSTGNYVSAAIGSITLSADKKKAALEVYGGTDNSSPTNQWDIYVGTIDGANLTQVTNDVYPDEVPQLNPAGTKVIFSSVRPSGDNYAWFSVIRNVDGTGEQVLPLPVGATGTWHAAYSPDGSKIAVEAWGDTGTGFDGIFLMNADGSNATMLTNPYNADCWCADEEPSFTSDGNHIVFSRENFSNGTEDVYIMGADGNGVTKLTDGIGINFDPTAVQNPTTKADMILFSSNRGSVSGGSPAFDLYSVNTDGTNLTRLTNNAVYDGFNIENYEGTSPGVARVREHNAFSIAPPQQRLRW